MQVKADSALLRQGMLVNAEAWHGSKPRLKCLHVMVYNRAARLSIGAPDSPHLLIPLTHSSHSFIDSLIGLPHSFIYLTHTRISLIHLFN